MPFKYVRYFIAILLLVSLFYSYDVRVEQETIKTRLDKKLPMVVDKKGFYLTIYDIEFLSVSNAVVETRVDVSVKISQANKFAKFLPKKSLNLSIFSKTTPKLKGHFLSFEVLSLEINKFLKIKKVKGFLKTKLEAIEIPIKKLQKYSWFSSVKNIVFEESGDLCITFSISKLLILLLLPLFLLREIGLLLIVFYQRFISPRKKYRCARGELHGDGTCSSISKEAFKKHGFIVGLKAYRKTTKQCKEAYKTLKKKERRDGSSCDCDYCACASGCDGGASGVAEASSGACSCDVGGC